MHVSIAVELRMIKTDLLLRQAIVNGSVSTDDL